MTTARYLSVALEGLADDVETLHPYQAHALRGIARDVLRLNARDLIGTGERREVPA